MRFIGLRCVHRPSCGRRPVVASAESGSATSIPLISRPPESALTATRASWSAVAAPAETPSSVAAVRIVPGICGFRPSTTPTNTASEASRWTPASPSGLRYGPLQVSVGDEYLQVPRPFRRGGRGGARGSQRGCDRRVLLGDDQGRGDSLSGGEDRQLGTEGEGSRVGRRGTGPCMTACRCPGRSSPQPPSRVAEGPSVAAGRAWLLACNPPGAWSTPGDRMGGPQGTRRGREPRWNSLSHRAP